MWKHVHFVKKSMLRFASALRVLPAATLLLTFALVASTGFAQGFGSSKKKITLHRKLPPTAHLNGTAISVQVLQGLQQSKGMDPMGKVYLYVRDQVATRAQQKQIPVMAQSDQGDEIVLGVPAGVSTATSGAP